MQTSRQPRAFSLVELMAMLAIIGILGAIAGPRYANSLALYRVQATAQRIIADVKLARSQARATSVGQTVIFNIAGNSYSLPGVTGISGQTGGYSVALANSPYMATLVSATFGSSSTLTFDRYGQPSAGGTIGVKVGAYSLTVYVDANTGVAYLP